MFTRMLITLLVLGCAAPAFGAIGAKSAAAGYEGKAAYGGPYTAERLYQFDPLRETWFASQMHRYWAGLACREASTTLETRGEWVGNLSDTGACAGKNEAPRWATGNYLNFLVGSRAAGSAAD